MADDVRNRLIARVAMRDQLSKDRAIAVVNRLSSVELIRLEMETREHEQPAFTSDYDPFAGRT